VLFRGEEQGCESGSEINKHGSYTQKELILFGASPGNPSWQ
jgi:hypothetical protein